MGRSQTDDTELTDGDSDERDAKTRRGTPKSAQEKREEVEPGDEDAQGKNKRNHGGATIGHPSFLRMNFMLCFNVCNGVLVASYMLLVLPLESQRFDNENRSVLLGSLMFIAGATQMVNPLVGLLSDRCLCSWGRRRPFIFLGGVLGVVGMLGQDLASMNLHLTAYYTAYTVSMFALNMAYTAVVGIMSDLIPSDQAGVASAIAAFHTVGGANFGFIVYRGVEGATRERLHAMYLSFAMITMVCTSLTLIFCAEVPLTMPSKFGDDDDSDEETEFTRSPNSGSLKLTTCSLWSQPLRSRDFLDAYYIDPRKHFDFTLVFWSRTFYYFGASVQAFFKYYLQDVVGVEDADGAIVKTAIIGQLCAAATAIPTGLISDRLGKVRKPFIYVACAMLAVGQIVNCFVQSEFEVLVVSGVLGSANGVYLAMDAALALDTLPSGDEAARFMGVWGIGCFLGGALGPVLGGPILTMCGSSNGAYHFGGYAVLFGMAASCFLASGAILYYVGKKIPGLQCVYLRRQLRKLGPCAVYECAAHLTMIPTLVLVPWCSCFPVRWSKGSSGSWLNS